MKVLIRNIAACFAGVILGGGVNMMLVMVGPSVIPPPAGVDVTDPEAIRNSIDLFEARHFLFPFLAHSIGTLVGALVAYLVAASHKNRFALVIGALFLLGGIAASSMIPAPVWFIVLDLVAAYIPMAWLGGRLGERLSGPRA